MEWLFEFPEILKPNFTAIDDAVRGFAVWADPVLSVISGGLQGMVSGINSLLSHIPWPVLVVLVDLLARVIIAPLEFPVGILITMIGVPLPISVQNTSSGATRYCPVLQPSKNTAASSASNQRLRYTPRRSGDTFSLF